MKRLKIILITFILLFSAGLVFFTFYFGIPYYQSKFQKEVEKEKEPEGIIYSEKGKITEPSRLEVINYIKVNLNNLTELLPAGERGWQILRFGFVKGKNGIVYVEFADEEIISRILVRCTKRRQNLQCQRQANYKPENFKWKLTQGEDNFSDRVIEYYEKNEKGEYKKSFTSEEKILFPIGKEALLELQKSVDNGYNLWRLNPLETAITDVSKTLGFDRSSDKYELVSTDTKNGIAVVSLKHDNETYRIKLYQPIKKGKDGIWVVESLSEAKAER